MGEAHEELMRAWSLSHLHAGQTFVRDGIIDPERWAEARRKVLFVLHEAYGSPEHAAGRDLRTAIRTQPNGPGRRTWWTVAYWAYALQNLSDGRLPRFPDDLETSAAAGEALLSSAVINIKKSNGRAAQDWDDLMLYADQDGSFIRRQVDLIDPQLVVCSNVWCLIRDRWPDARQLYDMVWLADGRVFVDFWHPANPFPKSLNYYALAAVVQNSGALEALSATRQSAACLVYEAAGSAQRMPAFADR